LNKDRRCIYLYEAITYLIERTSVLITVKDANAAAIDLRVCANLEVVWHERASVSLQDDLTLEESTLGDTRVDLFGLSEHDGLVFQVVEDGDFSVSGVLETAFDNVLFEVTEESQDLSIINKLEIRSSGGTVGLYTSHAANLQPFYDIAFWPTDST